MIKDLSQKLRSLNPFFLQPNVKDLFKDWISLNQKKVGILKYQRSTLSGCEDIEIKNLRL